ncbi:MAG: response regulator, partial [Planctomycetota bacterium]
KGKSAQDAEQRREQERRQQLELLMDKLDARDAADPQRRERKSIRASFRRFDLPTWVHHPGGSANQRYCITRDLSSGGVGLLHNGYLHVGTRLNLTLARYVGGTDNVRGRVQYCTHVGGNWHSVGVQLDRKIFPKLYLDPEQAAGVELEARDPQTVEGKVLYCDGSELDRELVQHFLRDTKTDLTCVANLGEAADKIKSAGEAGFDLVLLDLNLTDDEQSLEADAVMAKIRDAGHVGPVGVLTADQASARAKAVQATGVANLLGKPFDEPKMIAAVGEWVSGSSASGADQVFSTYASDETMRPLLSKFVTGARTMGEQLATAAAKGELEEAKRLCLSLRGSGGSFGYPSVTEAAAEALKSLESTMSTEESVVPLQHLQDACRRVTDKPTDDTPLSRAA